MLLAATAAAGLPAWLAAPLGLLFVLGLLGLVRSIGAVRRLLNPPLNAFEWPAAQPSLRFAVTQAGRYEVAVTRPGQWGPPFAVPPGPLTLRPLAGGPAQAQALYLRGHGRIRSTSLSGATTQTLATCTLPAPGEYELLNPAAAQFRPGDRLRLRPATGPRAVLLILAIVFCALITLASLILALLAALGVGG